ncbi:MAG: PilN domain-containing protein [Methylococcaceae bacterium]
MIKINLLPWRELQIKELNTRFYRLLGMGMGATFISALTIHQVIVVLDEHQSGRNQYLNNALTEMRRVAEHADELVQRLHEKQGLINRLTALEDFRSESVIIMYTLAEETPEELYLTDLQQTHDKIMLSGMARSEEAVSGFLHAIEASPLFSRPELISLENTLHDNGMAYTRTFTLRVYAGSRNNEHPQEQGHANTPVAHAIHMETNTHDKGPPDASPPH